MYNVEHFVAPGETLSSTGFNAILGGKGANQSVACAKAGLATYHVGGIGSGDLPMISPMHDAGVNMDNVQSFDDIPSGHAIIQVTPDAENAILLFSGANHQLNQERIEQALANANKEDWVLLQNETNCIADIIETAHEKGIKIAFNPAPMTQSVVSLPLEKLELLIVNEIEAMQLTNTKTVEDAKAALSTTYPDLKLVLTLGKQGVCYLHQNTEYTCEAFKVDAVDTTAAGDTFIGYFLATYDATQDVQTALKSACAASAISVTKKGAVPSIPAKQDVDTFLQQF